VTIRPSRINVEKVQPVAIRPTHPVFHRYQAKDMSGRLPPVVYKVLPEKHAHSLVHQGEMMWSTLAWFQNEEDVQRGDRSEGSRRYFPVKGLEVNRLQRQGRIDNAHFTIPSHGIVSTAAQSSHIFIYSMTLDPTLALGDPSDRACVEIFNPATFVRRVRDAVKRQRKAQMETLIHHTVRYWASENPPENVWPLPHLLTMHKHEEHRRQCEFRLAFGIRANVFDFENVTCFVVEKDFQWPRLILDPSFHRKKVHLGALGDCCRLLGREQGGGPQERPNCLSPLWHHRRDSGVDC
jgi:hypothetical protein